MVNVIEQVAPRKQVSKASVDYRRAANDKRRCGTCVMYHASRCDLVEGYIDPGHVCDRWEAKPQSVELVRQVRTARGVAFFHEPIGTPITEAEYQALLAERKRTREAHPVGHPERLAAERAVRQARKLRNAPNAQDEVKASKKGLSGAVASTAKSNFVSRESDKRLVQGQNPSNLLNPVTGDAMSKSEVGDTYEELFRTFGAHLLEERYGGDYQQVSHYSSGARNTPLDFKLDSLYGGELKTLSATSRNQKTAMAKESIERKLREVAVQKLSPLLVVQVVNQQTGSVDVYTYPAFASKMVTSMTHVGTYHYTPSDFADAHKRAGYGALDHTETDAMAARLTGGTEYQRLLDARRNAQAKYPVGHPTRVATERAVRQARRSIHGGEAPKPTTPAAKSTTVTQRSSRSAEIGTAVKPEAGPLIFHLFKWSRNQDVERSFRQQAEASIRQQFAHQAKFSSGLDVSRVQVEITAKPNISAGESQTPLGTMSDTSVMKLSPRVFPHVIRLPGGGISPAPFFLPGATPDEVLREMVRAKWWVPIDSKWSLADHVIAHEIGHGVNSAAFPRANNDRGIPDDPQFWADFARLLGVGTPVYGRNGYTYGDIAQWIERHHTVIAYDVSQYGAVLDDKNGGGKPREMFAELWAEYTLSSHPRSVARFYGDYITKLAKNSNTTRTV